MSLSSLVGLSRKELSLKSKNQPFTYTEIVSITNNFQTIIGEGGFGKVYLGNLKDGRQVAVKLFSQSSRQGYKEFLAEVTDQLAFSFLVEDMRGGAPNIFLSAMTE